MDAVSSRPTLGAALAAKLYGQSGAARWEVSPEVFIAAVDASLAHAFGGRAPEPAEVQRYAESLHLGDLAMACACAAGVERAWEQFVAQQRHALYRAAEAIDRSGGARDLADAIYGELFGVRERGGVRQSLFRYYHGRSSLATWLRAILSQRHVDRIRERRRFESLDEDDPQEQAAAPAARRRGSAAVDDADRARFVTAMGRELAAAIAALAPRDRLRLANYYARDLTLAAIGRMLGEHEATVSRHLTRTRREIRADVERRLREEGFDDRSVAECFRAAVDDAGPLDLDAMLGTDDAGGPGRKKPAPDRSR